jgi:hypothetical protein
VRARAPARTAAKPILTECLTGTRIDRSSTRGVPATDGVGQRWRVPPPVTSTWIPPPVTLWSDWPLGRQATQSVTSPPRGLAISDVAVSENQVVECA